MENIKQCSTFILCLVTTLYIVSVGLEIPQEGKNRFSGTRKSNSNFSSNFFRNLSSENDNDNDNDSREEIQKNDISLFFSKIHDNKFSNYFVRNHEIIPLTSRYVPNNFSGLSPPKLLI